MTHRLQELQMRWEQDPSSRIYLQLAEEYRRLGRGSEAVSVLEEGLGHRPRDLSGLVALGRCQLELEMLDEATERLQSVLARDPAHIVANKLLIEAYLQQGLADQASARLEVYRLLNDRDPELDHLEYRLHQLQELAPYPAASGAAADAGAFIGDGPQDDGQQFVEMTADDLSKMEAANTVLFDLSRTSDPETIGSAMSELWDQVGRHSDEADPFAGLFVSSEDQYRALLATEGIFVSALDADPVSNEPSLARGAAEEGRDRLTEAEIAAPELVSQSSGAISLLATPAPDSDAATSEMAADEAVAEVQAVEVGASASNSVAEAAPAGQVEEADAAPVWESELPPVEPQSAESEIEYEAVVDLLAEIDGPVAVEPESKEAAIEPEASNPEPILEPELVTPPRAEKVADQVDEFDTGAFERIPESIDSDTAGQLPVSAGTEDEAATVTLGNLYLQQGHREDAIASYRAVLEADPDNSDAAAGLARAEGAAGGLRAGDLLARLPPGRTPEGLTAKKIAMLESYRDIMKARRDVR